MKRLVGRPFNAPDVQAELSHLPFEAEALANGNVGIRVEYDNEPKLISAEHFLAMCLVKATQLVAYANNGASMGDCVMAVPASYNDAQRRAIMNACAIASVNCLKVTNEGNAVALSYGIFKSAKKLFSETENQHIMFIDLGYSSYSVTIAAFMQGNMKILASVCENNLGGRDYDAAIIEHLCTVFEKKTKINVRNNKKALLKLAVAAEKAKKTLSPNGVSEAPVNVECLAEDTDLACILKKDEFNEMTQALNDRLRAPIEKCLNEAEIGAVQLHEVEIVGGGSRVGMVKRTISEVLNLDQDAQNFGLKTTMNADEAVARGSALQCAMLSSRIRVQPFNIVDKLYYGIVATYDSFSTSTDEDEETTKSSSAQLYNRGDDIPKKPRRLTFRKKSGDFTVTLSYDATNSDADKTIAKYLIKVPSGTVAQDVRVNFNIDKNHCVYLQSAEMLEEIIEEAKPEAPAMDVEGGDDKKVTEGEGKEGDSKTEGDEKESEAKADAPAKKRFKKTDLETVVECSGLTGPEITKAIEFEGSMAFEDRIIVETADKRNELESYIYSMRDKLDGKLKGYYSQDEATKLKNLLNESEEWLDGDGWDATKGKYTAKLDELYAISNPIETRIVEEANRPGAIEQLKKQIESCKTFAANTDDRFKHIDETDRDKIRKEASECEEWMYDMIGKQGDINKNINPVLTCDAIMKKRSALFSATNPIMIKKAPAPAPVPEAKAEAKADENNADEKASDKAEGKEEETAKMESDAPKPEESSAENMDQSI